MLVGQSHASQTLIVQVPDPCTEGDFSANESRHSGLLLFSRKGPGVSHAGQDTTACESPLLQSSAGRSVSLPKQTLLTQTSGLEYSQTGLGERVLTDREVSSASIITPLAQDHAAENQDSGLRMKRLPWHRWMTGDCLPKKKGNERKNIEKALSVTLKEYSPRPSAFREACLSIAGFPAETTSHAPDMQVTSNAIRIAGNRPVTSLGKTTRRGDKLHRSRIVFSSYQIAELKKLFKEKKGYPSQSDKYALADKLGVDVRRIVAWFYNARTEVKSNLNGDEGATDFQMIAGLPAKTTSHTSGMQADSGVNRIVDNRPVIPSGEMGLVRHRPRIVSRFSVEQLSELNALYEETGGRPTRKEKDDLANKLGIESFRVDTWFGNTRAKKKKNCMTMDDVSCNSFPNGCVGIGLD